MSDKGPIVVLSHGMGQDSACLLALLTDPARPEIREKYVGDAELICCHADTGNEHASTIAYRNAVAEQCAQAGITYLQINLGDGYHTGGWSGGLVGQWESTGGSIGSVAYPATCSDSLKVQPIWKRINRFCAVRFDVREERKNGLREHLRRYGPIPTIIGIASGEESRVKDTRQLSLLPEKKSAGWFDTCVRRVYPLIDLGIDRAGAQAYLQSRELPIPRPSNCKFCPYKSGIELIHLGRTEPDELARWMQLEHKKLARFADRPVNYGVKGRQTLREFYDAAVAQYGHLSDEDVDAYVMSHGHCVPSKH